MLLLLLLLLRILLLHALHVQLLLHLSLLQHTCVDHSIVGRSYRWRRRSAYPA
jgi:hypothetical protein